MKKIFVLILCFFLLNLNTENSFAAYYDEGNDGDSWDTAYILDTAEDFKLFRDRVNANSDSGVKYYKLGSDIDLTAETDWKGILFKGSLDGQDHTIKVNIDNDSTGAALFSYLMTSTTVIKKLNVTGNVKGSSCGGIVFSISGGTIEDCSFNGTVEDGDNYGSGGSGGLVYYSVNGSTIKNCKFTGNVISGSGTLAGGIAAHLVGGTIENCTVSETSITAPSYAGGIVGYANNGYVMNCSVDVILNEASVKGGIIGGASKEVTTSGNKWPDIYKEVGFLLDDSIEDIPNDDATEIIDVTPENSQVSWNSHSYQIFSAKLTWEEAKAYCESLGGHLLTITSQAEQDFINTILENSSLNAYWLGAKMEEDGCRYWVTDEVFEKQYTNFAENQPDGSGNYIKIMASSSSNSNSTDESTENVTETADDSLGTWDDGPDSSIGFICEWDKNEETAETEIKAAPNSSLFEQWQSDPSAMESEVRPSPVDNSHLADNPPNVEVGDLPVSFDSRITHGLPPVRDQGNYWTCWAFAAIGAMEADYMAQKMTSLGDSPNLSELHLAWFAYKDPSSDLVQNKKGSNILNEGGNSDSAVSFLSQTTKAPVNESEMPYTNAGNDSTIESFVKGKTFKPTRVSLKEAYNFTDSISSPYIERENTKNMNLVKKNIMEHGAVYFTFCDDENGYDETNHSFYSTLDDDSKQHAVLLVGWNDNYPVENFKNQPSAKGAWLVRNSRGEDEGDGGYFWMSYCQADTKDGSGMGDLRVFIVNEDPEIEETQTTEDQSLQVQGHANSGKNKNITSTWSSAIFQSERDEDLIRVAFYTTDNNADYEVYVNNFGKLQPTDPGKAENALLSGSIPYAGYHTVDLENPVKLYKGDYYSVIVKMTLTSDYKYPTGVEGSLEKYAVAVVNEGENFFADGSPVPSLWIDGAEAKEGPFNACIKVFTTPRESSEIKPTILTSNLPDAYVGEKYNFTLSSSGTETIEWRSGNIPKGLALSSSGVLSGKPEKAGEFDIKLIAFNDVDVAETTLKLNIKEGSSVSGSGGGCNLNFGFYGAFFALAFLIRKSK